MEMEAGVREALDTVHAMGKQDGNEHVIVVRKGKQAEIRHGEPNRVSFEDVEIREHDITVHNHPVSLNSLSNVDIAQLFYEELDAVYCVSEDGSVYRAERGPDAELVLGPGMFIRISEQAILTVANESRLHGLMFDISNVGGMGIGEAHWVNRMLHALGIIKYSYVLQPATAAKVAELDDKLEFPKDMRV